MKINKKGAKLGTVYYAVNIKNTKGRYETELFTTKESRDLRYEKLKKTRYINDLFKSRAVFQLSKDDTLELNKKEYIIEVTNSFKKGK